jgi:cell fate (sporulation/competence/biofilm development) regulator YlbF (YheA/YmcA/DUF963 family)
MTREEFEKKVFDLTNQLTELVNQLPEIPELDDSLDALEYDESKRLFELSIFGLEQDLQIISDKYFDEA